MFAVLKFLCTIFLVLVLIVSFSQGWKWPYYHRIYNCLGEMEFEEEYNGVVDGKDGSVKISFIRKDDMDISEGTILLSEGENVVEVGNDWKSYVDLYTFYWWSKFVNWFKENVEHVDNNKEF